MILLSAIHVSHGYQRFSLLGRQPYQPVLKDINLTIRNGESVALLGRSGCGKSTLIRQLSGLEIPRSGEVLFDGKTTAQMTRREHNVMHRNIQMVFQDSISAVNPRHKIADIIAEPLRYLTNLSLDAQQHRVNELLTLVGLTIQDRYKRPPQMSGGQLQRVCIARALASKPKLVILDEALSSQDLVLQIQLIDRLKAIQQETGTAWLLVTHDLRIARQFCQRALIMDQGQIVEECTLNDHMQFQHPAAIQLQQAILPALPATLMNERTRHAENNHYH